METKDKISVLTQIYDGKQSLIALADGKANTSLTLQTFFIGYVLGSLLLSGIFNNILKQNVCLMNIIFIVLFIIFLITSFVGLIYCLLVVKARFPAEKDELSRQGLLYFNHIKSYKNSSEYLVQINNLTDSEWLAELSKQIYNISHIVSAKMKYLNGSIVFLFINLFLAVLLTLIAIHFLI